MKAAPKTITICNQLNQPIHNSLEGKRSFPFFSAFYLNYCMLIVIVAYDITGMEDIRVWATAAMVAMGKFDQFKIF